MCQSVKPKDLKKSRTALIDGDICAYRAAILTEKEGGDELDVQELVRSIVRTWTSESFCEKIIVGLSCPRDFGFRRLLSPEYKTNRDDLEKPEFLSCAFQGLKKAFRCVAIPSLEADDVLGILATNGKVQNPVIITIDKDLKQIPGWHYNPDKDDFPVKITEEEADYWCALQCLTGDSTDNYKGITKCEAFPRGVGPKTAEKILKDRENNETLWDAVRKAYKNADLSDEYMLIQAHLARILRASDWDSDAKKPIMWDLA